LISIEFHKTLKLLREQEAGGSNPLAPTILFNHFHTFSVFSSTAIHSTAVGFVGGITHTLTLFQDNKTLTDSGGYGRSGLSRAFLIGIPIPCCIDPGWVFLSVPYRDPIPIRQTVWAPYFDGDLNTGDLSGSWGPDQRVVGGNSSGFTLGIRAPGQTFNQCLIQNGKNYSAGEIADLTGLTGGTNFGNSFLGQVVDGNTFTGAYSAVASSFEDAATVAGTSTPDLLNSAIGTTTTFGRRTSNILALNLAGKGGLPQALSSSSGGLKSLLGTASKALNLGLEASLKAAIDAGLAGAEVIGCLVPR
jgi:hypothetical protein